MKKAIGIQEKPEVDLDKLDELANEEEKVILPEDKEIPEETSAEEIPEEPQVPETPKKEEPPVIDYKTKFTESQKEALVLKAQLDKAEEEKKKKVIVDEAFLREKYPEWEDLAVGEQKAIRRAEELAQEVVELQNNANQFNNDRKWQEKVDTFISEELPDLFPDIVGREEEFKRFATRPSRKGLPIDDLGKIFLFENPAIEKKRTLFHSPGSAGKPEQEPGMTAEEIRILRTTQPLKYMELVRAKKIQVKI